MMTPKKRLFVAEYLIDRNAKQAAIRAGYSKKTATSQGHRLLTDVDVASYVASADAKRAQKTGITQERVLAELAKIGFSDIRKAVAWGRDPLDQSDENARPNGPNIYPVSLISSNSVDDDTAAAISEVSLTQGGVKIKMHDKIAALDKLARHLGMFKDVPADGGDAPRLEITINTAAPVSDIRVTRHNA